MKEIRVLRLVSGILFYLAMSKFNPIGIKVNCHAYQKEA